MRRGLCLSYSLTPRWDFSKTCVHSKFKLLMTEMEASYIMALPRRAALTQIKSFYHVGCTHTFATVISMPIEIVLDR